MSVPEIENSTDDRPVARVVCAPLIDIYEYDGGLVLEADLPGVPAENLDLQVQDNKLTLFGRVLPLGSEECRLVHQEFRVADYVRSFILSDDVDHEQISATLQDGVLRVTLPRAPKPEPRRIQIRVDDV